MQVDPDSVVLEITNIKARLLAVEKLVAEITPYLARLKSEYSGDIAGVGATEEHAGNVT